MSQLKHIQMFQTAMKFYGWRYRHVWSISRTR